MIKGLYKIFDHWSERGAVWIISDPHFDDPDLIHAYEDRPSTQEQVKLINSKVGKCDTLIILGDVGEPSYLKQLRGYKVLLLGNHDRGRSIYEPYVDEIYEGPLMIAEKLILSHEPISIPWAFNIHGHVHSRSHKDDKFHFNVNADVIGYIPINFNQWMQRGGYLAHIQSLHRDTIDIATARRIKRGYKLGQKLKEKKA